MASRRCGALIRMVTWWCWMNPCRATGVLPDNLYLFRFMVFLFLPRRGRTGIRHSGVNAHPGQNVAIEYEPDHCDQDDYKQIFHGFPPFSITYHTFNKTYT